MKKLPYEPLYFFEYLFDSLFPPKNDLFVFTNKNTNNDCMPEFTDSSPMLYSNTCGVASAISFYRGCKTDFPVFLKPITAGPTAANINQNAA